MSDNDLIRRGDAIKAVDDWQGDWSCTVLALSALPAVQPRVKPLEWREISGFEDRWFADADIGVYSVSDPTGLGRWRWQWHIHNPDRDWDVLLDQSNQELARAFPTREDAIAAVEGHRKARILSALDNNTGKEVMPDAASSARRSSDIGPGDQAVAGAAKFALDRIREWASDNLADGTERDWHGHVGPALARLASTIVAQPEAVAGAAQDAILYGTGFMQGGKHVPLEDVCARPEPVAGAAQIKVAWPEDAMSLLAEADARIAWESLGFGADFAERVEAALESDPPEEVGILQARVEDQDREIADLTRQLQGQPRRQSDVIADTWQPIATAPKDRVIDLWSAEGGRYPDAIWDVHYDIEGWTDANDHRNLAGYRFTHWMDQPAGPTEGGE